MTEHLMTTYARLPVSFERGRGVLLWDREGREYLDSVSGIAVCNLGHAHPRVTEALCEQAATLVHTSNLYQVEVQTRLADRLCGLTDMDRAFFCNSGAEANEAAIKLARLYGHRRGIENPAIVVMEHSFHGRTLATISASGSRKVQAGFEPLVAGFVRAPYDDVDALRAIARNRQNVVAVLVEPVQGEGGINVPSAHYLPALREICDEHGWLLMADEIQTGVGRTGTLLASSSPDAQPDVVSMAKALGNGVPIGACLARGEAAEVFQPGTHGTTFGGNPLAGNAALAVLDVLEEQRLPARAAVLGEQLLGCLSERLRTIEQVREVRGRGLMIGIELDRDCGQLVGRALDRGLLINVTAGRVIRLLPPLIIDEQQAQRICDGVVELVEEFAGE